MQVGVIGSGSCYDDICQAAFRIGQILTEKGCVVINGGLGGVMEAVSRGAKSRNGVVIGIVPGKDRRMANRYCDYVIATDMGHARNMIIVHSSDALIAVGGELWNDLRDGDCSEGGEESCRLPSLCNSGWPDSC